jgi:hypothetical protein
MYLQFYIYSAVTGVESTPATVWRVLREHHLEFRVSRKTWL